MTLDSAGTGTDEHDDDGGGDDDDDAWLASPPALLPLLLLPSFGNTSKRAIRPDMTLPTSELITSTALPVATASRTKSSRGMARSRCECAWKASSCSIFSASAEASASRSTGASPKVIAKRAASERCRSCWMPTRQSSPRLSSMVSLEAPAEVGDDDDDDDDDENDDG